MIGTGDMRAKEMAHDERVAAMCRDDRQAPTFDQAAHVDKSLRLEISNLRRHIDGIQFMLDTGAQET